MNPDYPSFPVELGMLVEYRPCFGRDAPVVARVIEHGHKNGRPFVSLDNGHWAYLSQIVREVPGGRV